MNILAGLHSPGVLHQAAMTRSKADRGTFFNKAIQYLYFTLICLYALESCKQHIFPFLCFIHYFMKQIRSVPNAASLISFLSSVCFFLYHPVCVYMYCSSFSSTDYITVMLMLLEDQSVVNNLHGHIISKEQSSTLL